jgi:SAM-dependent methyltransferase
MGADPTDMTPEKGDEGADEPAWRARAASFGQVADLYDRYRPAYPAALFDDVVERGALGPGSRVVEAGAGTGKATMALIERGLEVAAIEPSDEMLAVLRAKTTDLDAVTCTTSRFEDWVPPDPGPFDALVSAQAWHWVDQEVGAEKAHALLRPGGTTAMLWNRPAPDESELRRSLDAVYQQHAPALGDSSMLVQRALRLVRERNDRLPIIGRLDDRFTDVEVREYEWTARYTTEEYVGLMQTHSDHILLDQEVHRRILDETAKLIDAAGGTAPYEYCTDLILARRR